MALETRLDQDPGWGSIDKPPKQSTELLKSQASVVAEYTTLPLVFLLPCHLQADVSYEDLHCGIARPSAYVQKSHTKLSNCRKFPCHVLFEW